MQMRIYQLLISKQAKTNRFSYFLILNTIKCQRFYTKCIKTFPCRSHQKLNNKVFDPFKIKYNHNIKVCFLVSVKTKTKLRLIEILSKLF